MVSQITSLTIVYSTVCLGAYQRKYQSSASLRFWGEFTGDRRIPHKVPVTRKMFLFDDVIMGEHPAIHANFHIYPKISSWSKVLIKYFCILKIHMDYDIETEIILMNWLLASSNQFVVPATSVYTGMYIHTYIYIYIPVIARILFPRGIFYN